MIKNLLSSLSSLKSAVGAKALTAFGIGAMGLVGAGLLLNAGGNSGGMPEGFSFQGRWDMRYHDRALGPVEGRAFIDDSEKKGILVLTFPEDKRDSQQSDADRSAGTKRYTLDIKNIKKKNGTIRFDVVGDWPGASHGSALDIGKSMFDAAQNVSAESKSFENAVVAISVNGKKRELDFKSGGKAEQDIVHVTLRSNGRSLAGRWHFVADGWSGREKDGNGRLYKIKRDDDGTIEAFGYEIWERADPVIELVTPLNYTSKHNEHPANGGENYRNILIIGSDLPYIKYQPTKSSPVETVKSDLDIKYSLWPVEDSLLESALPVISDQLSKDDFARIKDGLESEKLEALVLRATFGKDAMPGLTHAILDDGVHKIEISWLLSFDDYKADMQFARKLVNAASLEPFEEAVPKRKDMSDAEYSKALDAWADHHEAAKQDVYEPTSTIFTKDQFYVVLNTQVELPYAEIPLMMGVGEDIITFDGGQSMLRAIKDAEDPTRYVAGPFFVPVKGHTASVNLDKDAWDKNIHIADRVLNITDRVSVRVNHAHHTLHKRHWLLKTTSPIVSAEVVLKPLDMLAKRDGRKQRLFTTWGNAYDTARACYSDLKASQAHYSNIDDPYKGSVFEVDEFNHYILNNFFQWEKIKRSTKMMLGDHAAMVLLRDTYLGELERYKDELTRAKKNAFGFYKLMAPYSQIGTYSYQDTSAIMRQEVKTYSGETMPFYEAYEAAMKPPAWVKNKFDAREELSHMTGQALSQQIEDLEKNINMVREAEYCDPAALVEMTPRYYRFVAPKTFKSLYRQGEDGAPYEADKIARAWVRGLAPLIENQKAERELNTADNYMIMSEVAAVGLIPAAIGTASSLGSAGVAYLAGTSGAAGTAAAATATSTLAAETAFSMGGLWSAVIAAVEVGDVGYSSYMSYNDLSQYHQDLEFARTSQAFMGYYQYKELSDQYFSKHAWGVFDAGLNLVGAVGAKAAVKNTGKSLKSYEHTKDLLHKAFIGDAASLYARRGTLVQDSVQWAGHSLEKARTTGGLIYKNMQRKAFEFAYPELAAAQRAAEAKAARKLLVQEAEQKIIDASKNASKKEQQYLARIYSEVQNLPQAERELFAEWLKQFSTSAAAEMLDNPTLSRQVREIMTVYNYMQNVLEQKIFHELAEGLSTKAFDKVRRMYTPSMRGPLEALVHENPKRFSALITDEVGEHVLRGNAFESLDQYEKAIEIEKKRIRTPNPDGWAEITGRPPKGVYLDEVLSDALPDGGRKVTLDVSTNWWWGRKEGRFATFERRVNDIQNLSDTMQKRMRNLGLPEDGKMLTFASALISDTEIPEKIVRRQAAAIDAYKGALYTGLKEADPALVKQTRKEFFAATTAYDEAARRAATIKDKTIIKGMDSPMIKGKGTPLAAYLNQRAMYKLGIDYGDEALKVVKLENVLSKKTALQLHWLQEVYQSSDRTGTALMSIDEMLSHTDSYRYAESALNQAGFKITGARLYNNRVYREAAGAVSEFAADANTHSFGKEGLSGFLKRFSAIDPDENVKVGFDMYLMVEKM